MDISILFFSIFILLYVGAMIYFANQNELERMLLGSSEGYSSAFHQRASLVRWMLFGLLAMNFVYGLLILQLGFLDASGDALQSLEINIPKVDPNAAAANFLVTLVVTIVSFRLILSPSTRDFVRRLVGKASSYDPASLVHTIAIALLLCFISITFGQLALTGGLAGLSEDLETNGISLSGIAIQTVLMIAFAFIGVGMPRRRNLAQSLERLGMPIPSMGDVVWGLGMGVLLWVVLIIMATVWAALVPIDEITQQTMASDQIAQAFNTLPLAFLLSLSAALSEEILFRGALQPVLGVTLTSIFFALIHIQYSFTPATLIIFVVGFGLGWLRRRRNTASAIIAHFSYNFIQLGLGVLLANAIGK